MIWLKHAETDKMRRRTIEAIAQFKTIEEELASMVKRTKHHCIVLCTTCFDEWVIEVTPKQFREANGRSLDRMALMQSVFFDPSGGLPLDPRIMTMMRSLQGFFERHDEHGLTVRFCSPSGN
jgi:hypothetical protein